MRAGNGEEADTPSQGVVELWDTDYGRPRPHPGERKSRAVPRGEPPISTPSATAVRSPCAAPSNELDALLQAMARGDQASLECFYEATVCRVVALARAILRHSEDANEVACDVYVQVWQTAGQFDATRGSALAWLLTITRTRSVDLRRGRQRRERTFVPSVAPELPAERVWENPEQLLDLFQNGTEVHHALAALTPLRRELVGMAFFGDLSHTEIAAQTGLPLGTVKSHLRKALQALHAVLET